MCGLTLELRRPERVDDLAAQAMIDKVACAAKAASRGGSPLERLVRRRGERRQGRRGLKQAPRREPERANQELPAAAAQCRARTAVRRERREHWRTAKERTASRGGAAALA